jgi:exonuclease SbcD
MEDGGINGRLIDFIKTYNEAVDYTLAKGVDLCLIPGDIFRTKTPQPYEIDAFTAGIKKMIDNGTQVVVVVGNHDTFDSHILKSSISFLSTAGMEKFTISEKPEIITLQLANGPIQIQTMPYQRMSLLKMKSHEEVATYMVKTIDSMYESRNKKIPILFAGHFTIRDSKSGSEEKTVNKFNEPLIPKYAFEKKDYAYVAMGHLHKFQKVMDTPPTFYTGSINRTDFNEDEDDKGFMHVEVVDKKVEYQFIKVDARKFVDLVYDLSEIAEPQTYILSEIERRKKELTNSVAKLQVTVSESNRGKYDATAVTKILDGICNHVHGNSIPFVRKTSKKVESKFNESMTPMQAMGEYATIHVKNKEELGLFLKLGEQIIKNVNGRTTS